MPQAVTTRSLPQALAMIKAMQDQSHEWGEDYRQSGRDALVELQREQLDEAIDRQLEEAGRRGEANRRNGFCSRHPPSELADIELSAPHTPLTAPPTVGGRRTCTGC